MSDQEKVTRLKHISEADAWVMQFTINLEDRKPKLAFMLTKEGWDTLQDPAKDPTSWTGDEAEAVKNNKAAHKKIVKAMGLHKDLIDMVQTKTSTKASNGCAYTAIEYIKNKSGDNANNDLNFETV